MNPISRISLILVAVLLILSPHFLSAHSPHQGGVRVDTNKMLKELLKEDDIDGDRKITIDDMHHAGATSGDARFVLTAVDGTRYVVSGVYYLSNLLQELSLAAERGETEARIDPAKIFEPPTDYLSRMIREICWEGLTRRMDAKGLLTILADEKMASRDGMRYVYVPASDSIAYEYYSGIVSQHPAEKISLVKVPGVITDEFIRGVNGRHGILSLALARRSDGSYAPEPYVVPGGRFNEMYGWDSYFIVLGLLADRNYDLAQSMVNQQVYEIERYGKILNANRTYYLTRSQPPFLTSMARAVYAVLPKTASSKSWLHDVLTAAIREYTTVWMGPAHLTRTGLSRYFDTGTGPCPEVEPGHYDEVYARFARRHHMEPAAFIRAYASGRIKDNDLDEYFIHDRAMRESGHDTSYRLIDRAADLATVDLNSLLYKIETDIFELIRDEFNGSMTMADGTTVTSGEYAEHARRRKILVDSLLWDPASGMYFDYDVVKKARTGYLSAASFYPLWAGISSREQAASLVMHALPALEMPGGIASSSESSRGALSKERKERQWDFPNGWPPHQILLWAGFHRYGDDSIAVRLAYRWLYAMTINAVHYNGTITEKLNVVTRTHDVFAEYGNVGTKFSYITREGFGWSNASYQVGLEMLTPEMRRKLDRLIPPEWIFR